VPEYRVCQGCGQQVAAHRRRCSGCGFLSAAPGPPSTQKPADSEPAPSEGVLRVVGVGAIVLAVAGAGAYWARKAPSITLDQPSTSTMRPLTTPEASPRQAATRPSPQDALVHEAADASRAGSAAYAGGDLAAALAEYDKALARDPNDTTTRGNRAQVLVKLGRVADALPDLDRVVTERPEVWASHFNRARAYSLLKRWPEAVKDYQSAAIIFPDDYVTHYNLGLAHARTNDHASAIPAFERAVALAPSEPSFLISLGTEYMAANRAADARRTFEQFLRDQPDSAEAPNARKLLEMLSSAQ
jgi:tetratricopeptide (TPR) repeat protein